MATTHFIDGTTVVEASWANDVDAHTYNQVPNAHSAANISVAPFGSLVATNVQAALAELVVDTDLVAGKANKAGDTFTGPINVPAGATGTQAPQAQETTGKTSATGSSVLASGTTAQRDASPVSGYTRVNSETNQLEFYNGTVWVPSRAFQSTRVATTSGTAFDFTGIPAWVTNLTLIFKSVSLSSTGSLLVQLGTAASFTTTGYQSTSIRLSTTATSGDTNTTGFSVSLGVAANAWTGSLSVTKISGSPRTFVSSHVGRTSTTVVVHGSGTIDLADELTQLRVTRDDASTFDGGELILFWS